MGSSSGAITGPTGIAGGQGVGNYRGGIGADKNRGALGPTRIGGH